MILQECQTVEFKEAWRDEYLKTVCAFANTENHVSKPTATKDLQKLVSLKVIKKTGTAGESIKYILVGS